MVETTDMLIELKVPAEDVIKLYLDTAHITLQADIDAGKINLIFIFQGWELYIISVEC